MNIQRATLFFFLLGFALLIFTSSAAHAQSWQQYRDDDNHFSARLPENFKISKRTMRYNDEEIVIGAEFAAKVDQRPYKDVIKQYIVKYDQTLAFIVDDRQISDLIKNEVTRYTEFYESLGGIVRDKRLGNYAGEPGVELIVSYPKKDNTLQYVRLRIIYSPTTRYEQIMIGLEGDMFSYSTKTFFESLRVNTGRTQVKGTPEKEWAQFTSSFELFKMRHPYVTPPFLPEEPKVESSSKLEKISAVYVDPVYNFRIFHNTYGYRFNKALQSKNVQQILMQKHLGKFPVNMRELQFKKGKTDNFPVLITQMNFAPSPYIPYANTIRIRAFYYGNFLVVQELVGNNIHLNTDFANSLLQNFSFTPIEANLKFEKEKRAAKIQQQETDIQAVQ